MLFEIIHASFRRISFERVVKKKKKKKKNKSLK